MNIHLVASIALLASGMAQAGVPLLNYSCPGSIEVHADQGGPVYVNGKEAKLKKFSDSYYEASHDGVTISLMQNPDQSMSVSYTAKHGVHGVCQDASASSGVVPSKGPSKAEQACLAAVAKTTGVAQNSLSVIDVMSAEAGIGVMVRVPGADAHWSCLSDADGNVQGTRYRGSEGKL
ncbi:hypothetical protein FIV02_05895 [Pseudomonas sp. THAF187a]|nr:hypothetical protein FIV02_05895 [Pseudomonas sp. THAF187a]QFT41298.1 hypothetical protein FIU98_05885 [Pseudomonas sp. THAF42]